MADYPNSGALWLSKNKRNDKAPDMYGSIDVERDYLIELLKENKDTSVKIKIDGWRRKDKNDDPMVSIKINTYKKPEAQQQQSAKDPWDE